MTSDMISTAGHKVCEAISRRTHATIYGGNRLTLLPYAVVFFPELFRAVEMAQESVEIELYRIHPGRLAAEFAHLLLALAGKGVRVTVVLDGLGSRGIRRAELERWRCGGIDVALYNPLKLGSVRRLGDRNHRKLVVIDRATAFTGGMSIDDNFSHYAVSPWRETMLRVEGSVVADMVTALTSCASASVPAPRLSPTITCGVRGCADAQYVVSTPLDRNASAMYVEALRHAERTVHITTPYFIPPPDIADALLAAASRGIDVRIVTAGSKNDVHIARTVSRQAYGQCLSAGIRIFEYQPAMLHAKCMVVDGVWSTIGSSNLDYRSLWRSLETNLVTCDRSIASAMERSFDNDVAESEEITLEMWRDRPMLERTYAFTVWPLRTLF